MPSAEDTYTVRVCEFATNRSIDVELTARSSVALLKQKISEIHEQKPVDARQKLVLLGKPLNDPDAIVLELIRGKGIDPAETKTTIHLMLVEPVTSSAWQRPSTTSTQASTVRHRFVPPANTPSSSSVSAAAGRGAPSTTSAQPGPASPAQPTQPHFASSATRPASAPRSGPQVQTFPNSSTPRRPASHSAAPPTPASQPTVSDPIMMHPIMAAAYNAALCELANGNLDSAHTTAIFPAQSGHGQQPREIPLAVPAPLHMSPGRHYMPQRAPQQTIVINAQTLHLDGNNVTSLRALLSRANIHLHPQGAAAVRGAGAAAARGPQQRGPQQRGAAAQGGAFQREADGALRLQMQFHFNLMEVLRGLLSIVFMHLILGLSLIKVGLLVGGYFLSRALLRLNLHRGFMRWLDSVNAYVQQPHGVADAPAPAQQAPEGAAPGAGADEEGAAAAGGAAAVAQRQQRGTLHALCMGLLSFFLSLLPQFNADGANADAIAAAQDDLNNQNNDNDAAMAF